MLRRFMQDNVTYILVVALLYVPAGHHDLNMFQGPLLSRFLVKVMCFSISGMLSMGKVYLRSALLTLFVNLLLGLGLQ